MEDILENIKENFNNHVFLSEKRKNVYQLFLPIFHEDGDMVDIFIQPEENNNYKLCDCGMTLQRLSYSYDIDTPNKEAILDKIITENGLTEENGNICLTTTPDTIYTDIMHITHAFTKIGSMRYFKRAVIEHLFFEQLTKFVIEDLAEYNPKTEVQPLSNRDDLEADFEFRPNGLPVYMFGVKDAFKARLATIAILEFQKANLDFRNIVVHENFDLLPKKDRSRLTNACEKQFTTLEEFKLSARDYLGRMKHS